MAITTKEVEKIADLAHLEFGAEQLGRFVEHFQEILDYFTQLEAIPTDHVEPMYHALRQTAPETPMRGDEPGGSLPQETALDQAPDGVDGQFRVPRVID